VSGLGFEVWFRGLLINLFKAIAIRGLVCEVCMFHALLLHSSGDSEWCPGKGAIPLRAGSIDN